MPKQSSHFLLYLDSVGVLSLGCSLLLIIILNGCSSLYLPKFNVKPIDHYPYSQNNEGLKIAIYPLTDSKESKKYFGIDFTKAGLFPVLIVAKNQSSDTSFIIVKEQISLISEKAYLGQDKDPSTVASSLQKKGSNIDTAIWTTVMAGIFVFPPLAIVALPFSTLGLKMESDAKEIKRNLIEKELQTTTVSKGTTVYGFIYFKLPENNLPSKNFYLRIDSNNLKNKNINRFDFNISIKKGG